MDYSPALILGFLLLLLLFTTFPSRSSSVSLSPSQPASTSFLPPHISPLCSLVSYGIPRTGWRTFPHLSFSGGDPEKKRDKSRGLKRFPICSRTLYCVMLRNERRRESVYRCFRTENAPVGESQRAEFDHWVEFPDVGADVNAAYCRSDAFLCYSLRLV